MKTNSGYTDSVMSTVGTASLHQKLANYRREALHLKAGFWLGLGLTTDVYGRISMDLLLEAGLNRWSVVSTRSYNFADCGESANVSWQTIIPALLRNWITRLYVCTVRPVTRL